MVAGVWLPAASFKERLAESTCLFTILMWFSRLFLRIYWQLNNLPVLNKDYYRIYLYVTNLFFFVCFSLRTITWKFSSLNLKNKKPHKPQLKIKS